MPFVAKSSYQIQRIFNLIRPPVFIYEGKEYKTQAPLSFAYAGFHENVRNYWERFVLADEFNRRSLGRQWVWNIPLFIRAKEPQCNFLLLEHKQWSLRMVPSHSGFRIPYWVSMEIDLTKPEEALMGEQRAKTLKLMAEHKWTFISSKDKKDFEEYYTQLFLPYIEQKYSYTKALQSKEIYREIFSEGELILVKKGEVVIAGGLLEFKNKMVKLKTVGVRNGDKNYVHQGALAAVYYAALTEMKRRGFSRIHIGGTRPFFSDGVTRYKVSLNAQLTRETSHSCIWMAPLTASLGLKHFLLRNSFIFFDETGPCHGLFWEADDHPQQKEFNRISKNAQVANCERTYLYVFGNYNKFCSTITNANPCMLVKPVKEILKEQVPAASISRLQKVGNPVLMEPLVAKR